MEIANLDRAVIRPATGKDAQEILRLINGAVYTHIHADWHAPGDWLDTPGFVVSEGEIPANSLTNFGRMKPELLACLAVGADPYPAAWVRVAAIRRRILAEETLAAMLERVLSFLQENGVTELGWLAVESWPDKMLPLIGFRRQNWIITFVKQGLEMPEVRENGIQVRPVTAADMPALATLEAEAFEPLWRHSVVGLRLAHRQSVCFDVALIDGKIVGFQYSASNRQGTGAHLVRITVHPSVQGAGVGSVLMKAAVLKYRELGFNRVSLNTQLDNIPSHRLYEKFGFDRTGDQMPVWVKKIAGI